MVLNKPLLQEQSVPNELIFIETGQSGSHSRWTTTPANSGFEIGPHAASGRWHWWGFFLQCGGWKCVITHAVREIRFVLTLLVKKMMKCKEATWALISFYYYNATFLGSPLSHFQHLSRFRSANQISAVCTAHGKHVKSTVRQSYVVILDVLYSEENEIEMKVIQSTTWRQSWCHKSW